MKRFTFSLAAIVLLGFTSCKKNPPTVDFDIVCPQATFTIVGSAQPPENHDLTTGDITTNSADRFTANNTSADRVDSAFITKLEIKITSPPLEDFNLLDSIIASIEGAGLTKTEIARDVPHTNDNSKTITFSPGKVDVKEFVKLDKVKLWFWCSLDEDPLNNVTISVDVTFTVYARENES